MFTAELCQWVFQHADMLSDTAQNETPIEKLGKTDRLLHFLRLLYTLMSWRNTSVLCRISINLYRIPRLLATCY